jgi:hypothetical protein
VGLFVTQSTLMNSFSFAMKPVIKLVRNRLKNPG